MPLWLAMSARTPIRVSLVALPEAMPSTLMGLHDVLTAAGSVPTVDAPLATDPFRIEIVGERRGPMRLATGLPLEVGRTHDEVASTDLVLVPSLYAEGAGAGSGGATTG